jgi:hypothetical protein
MGKWDWLGFISYKSKSHRAQNSSNLVIFMKLLVATFAPADGIINMNFCYLTEHYAHKPHETHETAKEISG